MGRPGSASRPRSRRRAANGRAGNLDGIGYIEAHGLAAVLAILFIIRRHDGWRGGALTVHLLLGMCNIVFWPLFASWHQIPMGIAAFAMMQAVLH